jgi:RNA polymerase sigma-70 factor, ECF subfamily
LATRGTLDMMGLPEQPAPRGRATASGTGPSDAALVVAARAGEGWAREALFRRHASMVNGLAFRLLGRDDDLDDVVQESFVQALSCLHRLEAPAAFASWMCAIVARTTHKVIRRRGMLSRLGLRRPADPVDLEGLVAPDAPPDAAAELRAIYRAVDAMPAKIRIPFLLQRVEGLSLAEVAEAVGASLATVKRRVAEAERVMASHTARSER